MLKFYKTIDGVTHELAALEKTAGSAPLHPRKKKKLFDAGSRRIAGICQSIAR